MASLSSDTRTESRYQIFTVKYVAPDMQVVNDTKGVIKGLYYFDNSSNCQCPEDEENSDNVESLSKLNQSAEVLEEIFGYTMTMDVMGGPDKMDYMGQLDLVVADTLSEFMNIFMDDGWVPCGSPTVRTYTKQFPKEALAKGGPVVEGNAVNAEVYVASQAMMRA